MRLYIQQRKHAFTKSLSLNLIIKKNLEKTDLFLLIWKSRNTFSTVVFSSNLDRWCFTSSIVQFNFSLFVSQRVQWQSSGLDKMSKLERRTIYIKLAKWIYQWFGKYIATEFYPFTFFLSLFTFSSTLSLSWNCFSFPTHWLFLLHFYTTAGTNNKEELS